MTRALGCLLAIFTLALLSPISAQTDWTFGRTGLPGVTEGADIAFGNGRFVATFEGTGSAPRVARSLDGLTWTASSASVSSSGGLVFVAGDFYLGAAGQIYRSRDGATWTRVHDTPTNRSGPVRLASNGTSLLAGITTPENALVYSVDRVVYIATAPLPDTAPFGFVTLSDVAYGGGRYVVNYVAGSVQRAASTVDGREWTRVTPAFSPGLLAGGNGRVLGVTTGDMLVTSREGPAFEAIGPRPSQLESAVRLVFAGGRFISARSQAVSTDGRTWTRIGNTAVPAFSTLRDIAYGNGRYVALGYTITPPNVVPTVRTDLLATISAAAAPIIGFLPQTRSVVEGRPLRLSAAVENPDQRTTYQWFRDGAPIAGATWPDYVVPAMSGAHGGNYHVEVTNLFGTASSERTRIAFVPIADAGRIANLSVLTSLDETAPELLVGFVLRGTGPSKPLLVRAGGPSLALFGVANPHPDPRLELRSGLAVLGRNEDWSADPAAGVVGGFVGAFPFAPPSSRDAALYHAAVPVGDNVVLVSGATGASGAVIAELYDATPARTATLATPQLVNVSVRRELAAGGNLSVGFVIGGNSAVSVVVRAAGPALAAFGIARPFRDPALTVFSRARIVPLAVNDNWGADPQLRAQFTEVGAFPFPAGSADAALSLTLPPGEYVAQAGGTTDGAGTVLVEVYEATSLETRD